MNQKLLMIGCGKMGSALLGGFLEHGLMKENVTVIEPFNSESIKAELGCQVLTDVAELAVDYQPDIIIFAVKPQMLAKLLPLYTKWGNQPHILVLSIAAGAPISLFSKHLGANTPIIRLMPNLPALVGEGMTGAYACSHVSQEQKAVTDTLLASVGKAIWLENEEQMHAVTAIAGSGPAYLFHFIEALEKAATALGISAENAKILATQMVYGSAKMAVESDKNAEDLRIQVTSPNGTTAAALDVLMQGDTTEKLLAQATQAASDRSIALSQE